MPARTRARAGPALLPVVGQPPPERADAARNRRALLCAARAILVAQGIDAVTMDGVAAEAGVGIGTVYRRFGDRAGLAYQLLDDQERRFQQDFLSGPPPLGPGAPPAARIRAFLHAYLERFDSEAELHALAESRSPTARYGSGAYRTARVHLATLLVQTGTLADVAYLADALLALVGAGLYIHQRRELDYSTDRMKVGLDQLLDRVLPPTSPGSAAPTG